jgi:hypothetical protein
MTDQTSEERPDQDAEDRGRGFGVTDLAAAGAVMIFLASIGLITFFATTLLG